MIYHAVLTSGSESKPPRSPAHARTLGGRWKVIEFPPDATDNLHLYQMKMTRVPCFGLLGCNRQVSGEISDVMAEGKARGLITYKLDLMIDGRGLYATWTSLPTSPRSVSRVEVNLRISG